MKYFIYFFISIFFISCQSQGNDNSQSATKKTTVHHLSAKDFKVKMDELTNEQLVDVRRPDEVAQGYIPNARHINIADSDFKEKIAALNKEQPIMVYCAAGGRSKKACKKFEELGFETVYELDTGFSGWVGENFEVNK